MGMGMGMAKDGCGIATGVQFSAFMGFDMCVGAFQPCIATLRSKYVPDAQQSMVNNLFRLPLNLFRLPLNLFWSRWAPCSPTTSRARP